MSQPKNRSLQAKTAARMAAVQLAYRAKMRGETIAPDVLMNEYTTFRGNDAAMKGEAPSNALLKQLLHGLLEHGDALEKIAEEQLKEGWSEARTNPLLMAIVKLAVFELDQSRSLNAAVVVDEYTGIANKLIDHDEVGFVHAVLKNLVEKIRPA